jgi:hypothetical protein
MYEKLAQEVISRGIELGSGIIARARSFIAGFERGGLLILRFKGARMGVMPGILTFEG